MTHAQGAPHAAAKRPRDLRLDVFRGAAMLIILVAHIPGNGWTLWIPARFGFSDATEIFVFCSGLASALAFGAVFQTRGWPLGAARVAHRVWQVYWAHIGVFLATAALLATINATGIGEEGRDYLTRPLVEPFFSRTTEALPGLLSLRYVPGLFDILPMYLAILAMIPVVMALHRAGGRPAVAAFVAAVWLSAQLAGYAHRHGEEVATLGALGRALVALGEPLRWMNLPASPWGASTWFFNPFAWQLIFFTGFAFGMGWLRPPPVSRPVIRLAAAVLIFSLPLAWFRLYEGAWLPEGAVLAEMLAAGHAQIEALSWKTWFGALRYAHFLALAYLAWAAVGAGGRVLNAPLPLRPPHEPGRLALFAGGVTLLTAPYALVNIIEQAAPALDAWLLTWLPLAPVWAMGWLAMIHVAALGALLWTAIPPERLERAADGGWRWLVNTLRRVGSQSLAVFMTSIPLSALCGLALDHAGSGHLALAAVNLAGMAVLVGTAYVVTWFKGQPWRRSPAAAPAVAPMRAPAE
jgi:hypothetical protein